MINHLSGILDKKNLDSAVIEVNGVGYNIFVPVSTNEKLLSKGCQVKLYIVESFAMYSGGTTLYGFFSEEERDIFLLLKDEVPGTGAKKALEYLDKVTKSLPDFRRAVLNKDINSISGIFGFTKKTAEKIVSALKDKISGVCLSGKEKWAPSILTEPHTEAVAGLVALGYRETHAREAVEQVLTSYEKIPSVEEIIRQSLRYL